MGLKKRSQEDEELIDAIAKTTPDKQKLYIIDVRPRVSGGPRACMCVCVCTRMNEYVCACMIVRVWCVCVHVWSL